MLSELSWIDYIDLRTSSKSSHSIQRGRWWYDHLENFLFPSCSASVDFQGRKISRGETK